MLLPDGCGLSFPFFCSQTCPSWAYLTHTTLTIAAAAASGVWRLVFFIHPWPFLLRNFLFLYISLCSFSFVFCFGRTGYWCISLRRTRTPEQKTLMCAVRERKDRFGGMIQLSTKMKFDVFLENGVHSFLLWCTNQTHVWCTDFRIVSQSRIVTSQMTAGPMTVYLWAQKSLSDNDFVRIAVIGPHSIADRSHFCPLFSGYKSGARIMWVSSDVRSFSERGCGAFRCISGVI